MKDKLQRAGLAHDDVVEAFTDIFGESLAKNWFRQTELILTDEMRRAGLIVNAEETEQEPIDREAAIKKMQEAAAAELEKLAPPAPKDTLVSQVLELGGTEAQVSEVEGSETLSGEVSVDNIVEKPLDVDTSTPLSEQVEEATAVVETPVVEEAPAEEKKAKTKVVAETPDVKEGE
jgi:hypothetical protein